MFTGIIQELATVSRIERAHGVLRLSLYAPKLAPRLQPMESIAVNGVCLSVVSVRQQVITVEVIQETRSLTTLSGLRRGDRVNVEPSLSLSDRLGGHVVFGHVDGVGTIVARRQQSGEVILHIRVPASLRRWLVPKGPVAVDGVSLTVGRAPTTAAFTVHLIPETLRRTTLGARRAGDRVNVELDYFAKLIWQFLRDGRGPSRRRVEVSLTG